MSTALTPRDAMRTDLERMEPQFSMALPKHISAEKFTRVVMTAVNQTPDVLEANRQSFFASCMRLAQLGLLPDGREAALVCFGGKGGKTVTPMPMIAGILKLVRNSGELVCINSYVVHEGDTFSHWVDEGGEHFKYEPATGDRGEPKLVFASAKTKDGGVYFERMSIEEVEQVRNVSRAKDNGPWKSWWSEMARKTVLRRLSKRLPMSSDLDAAIRADDELTELEPEPVKPTGDGGPSRLRSIVSSSTKAIEQAPQPSPEPEPTREPGDDSEELAANVADSKADI